MRHWRRGARAGYGCKLDDSQLGELRAALDLGPAAAGWDQDQRWTLARVAALISGRFGISYTLRGVSYLLHRIGFTRRSRCTGPPSATRPRSPSGAARPGRRYEASGGDRGVDLL